MRYNIHTVMFTHLHCIDQWIIAYVRTHVIITQIKILGGASQHPKKASLCPFPANPPHLQEVTTSWSPWIYFACFWISYKWVHMIRVGFCLVTVFFISTLVCEIHPGQCVPVALLIPMKSSIIDNGIWRMDTSCCHMDSWEKTYI